MLGHSLELLEGALEKPTPWRIALVAYLVGLAMVGYWPAPVDKPIHGTLAAVLKYLHSHGVPGWFDYQFIEASANVAIFIPFGILTIVAMPAKPWWQLAGIGLLASICMELGQLLFITARFFSPLDLVTNTLGSVIGISAVRGVARMRLSQSAET